MRPTLLAALAACLLAAPTPAAAQAAPPPATLPDTTAVLSDRQLRQQAGYAVTDAAAALVQLQELLARAEAIRRAAHARVTRDSLRALSQPAPAPAPPVVKPPAPPADTAKAPPPIQPPAPGALLVADDFDGGFRGTGAYAWKGTLSTTTAIARSGARSLRFDYAADPPCGDATSERRFDLGENMRELWIEYYIYFPDGSRPELGPPFVHRTPTKKNADGTCSTTPDASSNNKFLRLWDTDYNAFDVKAGFEYRTTVSGTAGDSRLYGMYGSDTKPISNWDRQNWDPAISDATRGRWVQVRVHVRIADSKEAANGVLRLWADGVLRINLQGLDLAASPGGNNFFRNGYLMGWANSGFDQPTSVFLDDFKIYRADPGWR